MCFGLLAAISASFYQWLIHTHVQSHGCYDTAFPSDFQFLKVGNDANTCGWSVYNKAVAKI
jgi:hypothetical protein